MASLVNTKVPEKLPAQLAQRHQGMDSLVNTKVPEELLIKKFF